MPSTFPIYPTESPVQPVRLVLRGILPDDWGRTSAFLWNLAGLQPTLWPIALRDWAHTLAICAYARHHLGTTEAGKHERLRYTVQRLIRRLHRLLKRTPTITVTVQIREVAARGQACIGGPLEPRCHYADRITVETNRSLLSWLDSLVFRITAVTEQ